MCTSLEDGGKDMVEKGIGGPAIAVVTRGSVVLRHSKGEGEETLGLDQVVFFMPGNGFGIKATKGLAEVWTPFVEAWLHRMADG